MYALGISLLLAGAGAGTMFSCARVTVPYQQPCLANQRLLVAVGAAYCLVGLCATLWSTGIEHCWCGLQSFIFPFLSSVGLRGTFCICFRSLFPVPKHGTHVGSCFERPFEFVCVCVCLFFFATVEKVSDDETQRATL